MNGLNGIQTSLVASFLFLFIRKHTLTDRVHDCFITAKGGNALLSYIRNKAWQRMLLYKYNQRCNAVQLFIWFAMIYCHITHYTEFVQDKVDGVIGEWKACRAELQLQAVGWVRISIGRGEINKTRYMGNIRYEVYCVCNKKVNK